jgi:Spy/CpxP family protein refolding chaperone
MKGVTMKRFLIIAAILSLLAAPAAVVGQGYHHGPMGPGAPAGPGYGNLLECKEELNLSKDQMEKIEEINFNHHQMMIDLKAELEKAKLKKRREMHSDAPNKTKVLVLTKEIVNIHGKMAEARVEHRFAIRQILTKEQLEKRKECRQRYKADQGPGPRGDRPERDIGGYHGKRQGRI